MNARLTLPQVIFSHRTKVSLPGHHWKSSYASSLFTNYSSYSTCILVLPLYLFVLQFFLYNCERWRFAVSSYLMASMRDINITDTSHSYKVMNWVRHCWNWNVMRGFHVLRYGASTSWVNLLYFPQWLDGLQRCFSCCSLLIQLCNGQNIAAYEYGSIINLWGACASHSFFIAVCMINQPQLL